MIQFWPPTAAEKGKREKNKGKSRHGESAGNPETVVVVLVVWVVPVAIRTPAVPRIVVPRAAARVPTPFLS